MRTATDDYRTDSRHLRRRSPDCSREGLALIINQEADMKMVGSCSNGDEALELFKSLRPLTSR